MGYLQEANSDAEVGRQAKNKVNVDAARAQEQEKAAMRAATREQAFVEQARNERNETAKIAYERGKKNARPQGDADAMNMVLAMNERQSNPANEILNPGPSPEEQQMMMQQQEQQAQQNQGIDPTAMNMRQGDPAGVVDSLGLNPQMLELMQANGINPNQQSRPMEVPQNVPPDQRQIAEFIAMQNANNSEQNNMNQNQLANIARQSAMQQK